MVLISARDPVRGLPFGLSAALTLLGLLSLVPGSVFGGGGTQSNTPAASPVRDTSGEINEIKLLIAKYAQSVDEADTGLASQIWLDSPEVSFIHPLGHEHGLEQIEQNVYRHLMGDTFSERKLSIHDISIHVHGDSAWAEFYWDFAAKRRKDGSPVTTHGRETQVYWKEQGRWRLVHIHYSGMPFAVLPRGF